VRKPWRKPSPAVPAPVDGTPALVWAPGGQPRVVINFRFEAERILAIDLVAEPERIPKLDLTILEG